MRRTIFQKVSSILLGFWTFTQPFLVINALTNFANVTLSSLYFDITKDSLYANHLDNPDRMAVVAVLEQVKFAHGLDMEINNITASGFIYYAVSCQSRAAFSCCWSTGGVETRRGPCNIKPMATSGTFLLIRLK